MYLHLGTKTNQIKKLYFQSGMYINQSKKFYLHLGTETNQIKNCTSNQGGTSTNLRNCTNIVVIILCKTKIVLTFGLRQHQSNYIVLTL